MYYDIWVVYSQKILRNKQKPSHEHCSSKLRGLMVIPLVFFFNKKNTSIRRPIRKFTI